MKKCIICGKTKEPSEFFSKRGGGYYWQPCCKVCQKELWRQREKNHPRNADSAKKWKKNNPEKVRAQRKRYRERNKVSRGISCLMRRSLKNGLKAGRHWETLVGFTVDQLKKYLEKKFQPGMTWGNYGIAWHIDHKIPKALFNFERPEDLDFKRCWSLKNLQPMLAKENMSKGSKIGKPFQPSLRI